MSVQKFNRTLACLALCLAVTDSTAASRGGEVAEAAQAIAEITCASCHGPRGSSTLAEIPSLAAQSQVYLAAKMKQFRVLSRGMVNRHIELLGVVLEDDETLDAFAAYFAKQPAPAPMSSDPKAVAAGHKIFSTGIESKGVAACTVCHGPNAEGFWIVPRLAGQQAHYVERQLKEIQLRIRNAPGMHAMVKDLSLDDIKAVAAYVQSK